MSRNTSTTFREAVFAQETGEAFIILITIDHDDLADPIRVCSNATDVVLARNGGETYIAYPFEFSLPDDTDERISAGTITIDNVSTDIAKGIRALIVPPTVTIEIVLASDVNTIEASFDNFELIDVQYDSMTIQGNISIQNFMNEPYPGGIMGPANFPGIF
jgi:hypothetical protein